MCEQRCIHKAIQCILFMTLRTLCLWRNFSLGKILNGDLVKLCSHFENGINLYLLMPKIYSKKET